MLSGILPIFRMEPELRRYLSLPGADYANFATINNNIKAIKYGSGVVISGLTGNISNATGYLFLSNPSVDLRWLKGFYLNLNDGSKNLKVLVGDAGTGETLSGIEIMSDPGFDNAGLWTAQTNWSVTGGKGVAAAAAANAQLYQTSSPGGFTVGALYKQTATFNIASGSVALRLAGVIATANAQLRYLTAIGAGMAAGVIAISTFTGDVDSLSIQKVVTPSATGIYFSSPTVDSGFNYNAASFTATATRN